MSTSAEGRLALADYRRRVASIYARVRSENGSQEDRWLVYRRARDRLFKRHPQSALRPEARQHFEGLRYFPYNPSLRFEVELETELVAEKLEVTLAKEGRFLLERVGQVHLSIEAQTVTLSLYWISSYGGGLFLPFRDATNGDETYGGGRYLLDTIKGADLGQVDGRLVLDFNYAYNPSCAYDPRWHCPLAPMENWLEVPVHAGEMAFEGVQVRAADPTAIPRRGS